MGMNGFCSQCGAPLVSGAKFCSACGEAVMQANEPPRPVRTGSVGRQAVDETEGLRFIESGATDAETASRAKKQKAGKAAKRSKAPIIVCACISALLFVVLALLLIPKGPRGIYTATEYCWVMNEIEFVDGKRAVVEDRGYTIQCNYTIDKDTNTIRLVPLNNILASTVEVSFRDQGDVLYFDGCRFEKRG